MMCHKFLLLVVNLWVVGGSLVEFSDTMDSVPPLFGLDDWTRCQRPGDVYCVMEAALVSGNQSTMQLIKDYSAQTLQHYNRTVVHRGVCASRCAGAGRGHEARAQSCVNDSVRPYGFEAQFNDLPSLCVRRAEPQGAGGAQALAAVVITLVMLAGLATIAHTVAERLEKDCSKFVLAFSLRQNWQILTYDRTKPRTDERMGDVACMEGIRVIGVQCVIFAHVILVTSMGFVDNPQFLENIYENFMGQAIMNSPVWLQSFFCISGFLTCYTTLVGMETSPFTPLKAIVAIMNRWMRLTPVAGFMLWFTISWLPGLGSGPLWSWYVEAESEDCGERWWYHLLYVHNHLPLNKMCMGHTWYLAVDMQLHVLGMLLLLVLVRCRRAALPLLAALLVGSATAAGLTVYWYRLMPIVTAQSPEDLRTFFAHSMILPKLYLPMWVNLGGYVCGLGVAFILYELQARGIKLKENKSFNLIYHLSIPLGTCVVLNGVWFLRDVPPPHWSAVVYASLDRPLIGLLFSVFMLGAVTNCRSHMRSLIAWRGFHVFGRLSYCVFISHFFILRLLVTSSPNLVHITALYLLSLLITTSILAHLMAIPLCLLVELPSIQLFKAFTEKPRPPRTVPLDLVATKSPEV